jgi:hypothetical protein
VSRSSKLLRRVLPALVVAALAIVAAGCDWTQPPAVTGKGYDVSGSSFAKLIKVTKNDKATDPNTGKATKALATPTPQAIADMLTLRITGQFFLNQVAERHLTLDQNEIDTAKGQIGNSSSAAAWPKAFQTWLARAIAAQAALFADIDKVTGPQREAAERELYAQTKGQNSQTCVDYVGSTTQAVVATAASQVRGGKSFADATTAAQTTDPQAVGSGATPRCLTDLTLQGAPADLASAIASAQLNDVVGPITVQSQDSSSGAISVGYYLIRVVSRGVPTFEQMRSQLDQQYAQSVASNLRDKVLRGAHISIDPRYGSWDSKTFAVTAPQGLPSKIDSLLNLNNPNTANGSSGLSGLSGSGTSGG